MIIIDIPSVVEILPVEMETEKETMLFIIVHCMPGPLGTFIDDFILFINVVEKSALSTILEKRPKKAETVFKFLLKFYH